MPRANRYYLPGNVWHITHRCHKQEFLLKFAKDRQCWRFWLYEAKKRYKLCVLNYMITSNHIHLLVQDTREGVISRSMQLIAGRTAQDYNLRKGRKGAYWEDRYHATAVQTEGHLAQCIAYIDMNMVRAGVVKHPMEWKDSGYYEMQKPPKRYTVINQPVLMELLGIRSLEKLQQARQQWVESLMKNNSIERERAWVESIAVGEKEFVTKIKEELGLMAKSREVIGQQNAYVLKEPIVPYNSVFDVKTRPLSENNEVYIDDL